jgi:flagellar hook-associated protein 1 FlgK
MSIGSILNTARNAMNVHQTAIQIASQNVSNVETPGYSRQRAELTASTPQVFPYGSVGTGVTIATVSRARDAVLDTTYRDHAGASAGADTTNQALSQIQTIFNEPSDTGLSSALDKFWSAWSDLASNPTNSAAKSVVVESGRTVAATLNQFASQLDQLDQNNREAMNADVGQVNAISKQIADLNVQIVSAESGNQPANDLRDKRDLLLDKLSQLTGGEAVERSNGGVAYYLGGRMLVDGAVQNDIVMNDGQPPTVGFRGAAPVIDSIGGSLGAAIDVSASQIPTVMTKLDALAKGLVQTVNGIHSTGTVYSGTPPVGASAGNFFAVATPASASDPLLTARGIRLDPTLTSATVAASNATGPGDNSVALALSQLNTSKVTFTDASGNTLGTSSMTGFFTDTVGAVATAAQHAEDVSTAEQTLASNADTRRQSVSGVSTDEELISIIQHQQAYQAAARIVSVVNDMTDTLVNLGR